MEPIFRVRERTERAGRSGERFGVSKGLGVGASTVAGWRAAGLVPKVRQALAEQEIPPVGPARGRPEPGPQMGNGVVPFAKTKRGAAAPGALGARSHRPAPATRGGLPGPDDAPEARAPLPPEAASCT